MITLPQCFRARCLDSDEHLLITKMYRHLYPNANVESADVAHSYRCYSDLRVGIEHYGSILYSRSRTLSGIMAAWCNDNGNIMSGLPLPNDFRPGRVKFYMKHSLTLNGKVVPHILACVDWFMPSESTVFKKPVTVWRKSHFAPPGPAVFLPVQRVAGKFAWAIFREGEENMLVVCPLHVKVFN